MSKKPTRGLGALDEWDERKAKADGRTLKRPTRGPGTLDISHPATDNPACLDRTSRREGLVLSTSSDSAPVEEADERAWCSRLAERNACCGRQPRVLKKPTRGLGALDTPRGRVIRCGCSS